MLFPWCISLFTKGFFDVAAAGVSVKDPSNLERLFKNPPTKVPQFSKRSLPCWSPALYTPGQTRANANVQSITALVYDMDDSTRSPEDTAKALNEAGLAFVVYTTWSHTIAKPKYRIVFFLTRPLTPQEYPTAWAKGLAHIGYDSGVDRIAKDISRHYALPAQVAGGEYMAEVSLDGKPLDADKLSQGAPPVVAHMVAKSQSAKSANTKGKDVPKNFKVLLDTGEMVELGDLIQAGAGKHKCTCPFQDDASKGSAFVRVCDDGRTFIYCASKRHTHDGKRFFVTSDKKKKAKTSRTTENRVERLEEVPEGLCTYVREKIAYSAPQGVFYRYSGSGWDISSPMRTETITNHLIGLMTGECGLAHARALLDDVISRQIYGFDCRSIADRFVVRDGQSMLNLYALSKLVPKAGKCPRIKDVIRLLCDDEEEVMRWLLHWSAALVQFPERRSMVAVIVLSPQQGIGKSMYGRLLSTIIGEENSTVVSNKALNDSFNSHYVTKLLVLADEVAVHKGRGNTMAEVKAAITDDRVHCAAPYASRITITNRMSWWLTSNKPDPILLEKDDRRFTVLAPGKADKGYRQMLRDCFDSETSTYAMTFVDELRGFAHYLKKLAINWDLISRPVVTKARETLQDISADNIDAFCEEIQKHGIVHVLNHNPPPPDYPRVGDTSGTKIVPTLLLYGSYRTWCQRNGIREYAVRTEALFRASTTLTLGIKVLPAYHAGQKIMVYSGLARQQVASKNKVVPLHPKG